MDFEFEFELDSDGEAARAQPLISRGQQERADGKVEIIDTYTPEESREFLEIYRSGKGILAWILQAAVYKVING